MKQETQVALDALATDLKRHIDGAERRLGERIDERHGEVMALLRDTNGRVKEVEKQVAHAEREAQRREGPSGSGGGPYPSHQLAAKSS